MMFDLLLNLLTIYQKKNKFPPKYVSSTKISDDLFSSFSVKFEEALEKTQGLYEKPYRKVESINSRSREKTQGVATLAVTHYPHKRGLAEYWD